MLTIISEQTNEFLSHSKFEIDEQSHHEYHNVMVQQVQYIILTNGNYQSNV
jgi:hypothetical protein